MALFISFEGLDGSGKSTQAVMLAHALRRQGHTVTETREPGGTALGERVRELILHPAGPPATALTMALLLSASRAQLLEEVILPALGRGEIVIVDRYADSTAAYQGHGLGMDPAVVNALRGIATNGIQPAITVYVDVPAETGLERLAARGDPDRLDAENLSFHRRVRNGYLDMVANEPDRWLVVDGSAAPEQVHLDIMNKLGPRLGRVRTA